MINIPTTEKAQRLVTEIFEFAIRNNPVPTKRENTGAHPTFFVWYSGHINGLTVHISPNGWSESGEDEESDIYLSANEYKTAEEIEAKLERVLARMTEVMNEWEAKQNDK
jgi:hypothetical protein